jgi:hypothetical protein
LGEVCANGIYVTLPAGRQGCAQGRDQYAVLLPVRERVLGPEHPDTLDTRYDLAYWAREADGDPDAAEN